MLQAFVSLKHRQPGRTASEVRRFFEAIFAAMYSQPTHFCTDAQPVSRSFDLDALCEATLDTACHRVFIRCDDKKFWQLTFLLQDRNGYACLFFDFERKDGTGGVSVERLVETAKRLYKGLQPRTIRVSDSEAREKLKSVHNFVFMPGFGRIEWLQIVSHDTYSPYYNTSELAVVPAHTAELWPDNTFFLRVYGDPKDWENEENRSYANFAPANLAGIAKISDASNERELIKSLEQLRNFAEKQAASAYALFDADKEDVSECVTQPMPVYDLDAHKEAPASFDTESNSMTEIILARLVTDYPGIALENLNLVCVEGPCTIYKVHHKKGNFYASYQDMERKVFHLDDLEDLSKFIQANGFGINSNDKAKVENLVKKYHRSGAVYLNTLQDLPRECRGDDRLLEVAPIFNSGKLSDDHGAQILHLWYFLPETAALEELKLCQFEQWPVTAEAKRHALELEGDADKAPETMNDVATPKFEQKIEERVDISKNLPAPKAALETPDLPTADTSPQKYSHTRNIVMILILIILAAIVVYLFYSGNINNLSESF